MKAAAMRPKKEVNDHGFELLPFVDTNGNECSLQQSSGIGDYADAMDNPGTSLVWLGDDEQRMHLNREQVKWLVEELTSWLDTGQFR